jgi:membrane protease YdiL (CAAX protease family)
MDDQQQQSGLPASSSEQIPIPPVQSFIERHGISPIIFALVTLIVIFIAYQMIGGVITYFLFGINPTPDHVEGLRIVTGLGQLFFILVPTLIFVRLGTTQPSRFLHLEIPDIKTLIVPVVGIVSLQQMLQIYMIFQDKIPLPPEIEELTRQLKDMIDQLTKLLAGSSTLPELLWVIIIIALIPAVAEEFLFRGLVQRSFERQMGAIRAVILTGIIFAFYHLNPFSFVPLAVLGMYLGFLAMRARSIWSSIAAHFYNNTYACISIYLKMDDNVVGGGNPEQLSTGWLLMLFWFFGVIFIVSTLYFLKITRKPAEDSAAGQPTVQ